MNKDPASWRENWRQHVETCKKAGRCINCPKLALLGEQRCKGCKVRNRKRCKAWMKDNAEQRALYDVQRKEQWVAKGQCPTCAEHRPVVPGYRRCLECQARQRSYDKRRRAA